MLKRPKLELTPAIAEKVREYFNEGRSLTKMGVALGVSAGVAARWCRELALDLGRQGRNLRGRGADCPQPLPAAESLIDMPRACEWQPWEEEEEPKLPAGHMSIAERLRRKGAC